MLTEMRYVNAFIEEGSDSTLMRQGFADPNKIFSVHQILTVEGASGVVTKYRSQRVNFKINADLEKLWIMCFYSVFYRSEHHSCDRLGSSQEPLVSSFRPFGWEYWWKS
jgi:hypothetical protein